MSDTTKKLSKTTVKRLANLPKNEIIAVNHVSPETQQILFVVTYHNVNRVYKIYKVENNEYILLGSGNSPISLEKKFIYK